MSVCDESLPGNGPAGALPPAWTGTASGRRAGLLLSLLRTRCMTWTELASCGLRQPDVLAAVGLLVAEAGVRVLVGPLAVGIEWDDEGDAGL